MRMLRGTIVAAGAFAAVGLAGPVSAAPLVLNNLECDDYEIHMVFNNGLMNEDLSSVECLPSGPTPTPNPNATPTPRPTPTQTPGTNDGCTGIALSSVIGDNWLGLRNQEIKPGQQVTYCARLTRTGVKKLVFSTYEVSDGQCGRLELVVRQIGNLNWTVRSGYASSPSVTVLSLTEPGRTAPGTYEITAIGGNANPGCTHFNVAWKAY